MRRFGCVFLAVILLFLMTVGCADESAPLEVAFLDVGQGDAALIRTTAGDVLIDTGTEQSQESLCLRLRELEVTSLSLLILTHADEDHMGGADGVLRAIPTDEIWVNGDPTENEAILRMREAANETGAELRTVCAGESFSLGEVFLSVLAPMTVTDAEGNEGSLVVKLHYGKIDALFMGDAGVEQEADLLATYGAAQLKADLYKVGHHGSNTSTSFDFLQAVAPAYAVVSCGAGNPYGHPMGSVLDTLDRCEVSVLRTDLEGEILFESDGETLWWISN